MNILYNTLKNQQVPKTILDSYTLLNRNWNYEYESDFKYMYLFFNLKYYPDILISETKYILSPLII
jgi:hypothetical protein